jgi:hypothetical protein
MGIQPRELRLPHSPCSGGGQRHAPHPGRRFEFGKRRVRIHANSHGQRPETTENTAVSELRGFYVRSPRSAIASYSAERFAGVPGLCVRSRFPNRPATNCADASVWETKYGDHPMLLTAFSKSIGFAPADFTVGSRLEPNAGQRSLNPFCCDRLFRGGKRTFGPSHRGVVTTDALQVGAAGEGDNRHHPFSACRAARDPIHEILPICPITWKCYFCSIECLAHGGNVCPRRAPRKSS